MKQLVKTTPALEINLLHQKPALHISLPHIRGRQFQLTTEGDLLNLLDLKRKTFHIYKGIEQSLLPLTGIRDKYWKIGKSLSPSIAFTFVAILLLNQFSNVCRDVQIPASQW